MEAKGKGKGRRYSTENIHFRYCAAIPCAASLRKPTLPVHLPPGGGWLAGAVESPFPSIFTYGDPPTKPLLPLNLAGITHASSLAFL